MDCRASRSIHIGGSGGAQMTTSAEYIPQVKAEHNAVCSGESGMLPHAIACGKLLSVVEDLLEQENSTMTLKKNHVGLNKWAKDNAASPKPPSPSTSDCGRPSPTSVRPSAKPSGTLSATCWLKTLRK